MPFAVWWLIQVCVVRLGSIQSIRKQREINDIGRFLSTVADPVRLGSFPYTYSRGEREGERTDSEPVDLAQTRRTFYPRISIMPSFRGGLKILSPYGGPGSNPRSGTI